MGGASSFFSLTNFRHAIASARLAPVIAVVRDGRTLLDCRTIADEEVTEVAAAVSAARQ